MKKTVCMLTAALWPAVSQAHPGHGVEGAGHLLLSPQHAWGLLAAGVLAAWLVRAARTRREVHDA